MKSVNYKKYLLVGAMMALVILVPLSAAHAAAPAAGTPSANAVTTSQPSTPNWFSCAANAATCGVYYIALTVDNVMTVGVTLGAFLIRLGLQFNDNIFNSPAVQTGFSVSLAIANLGFVLGIIIIAIATIIRNQTYGMKQLLWKLVMMAILVNFGLVIMAPIVGFASSMSNYFINATSPSAATGGYEGYATTMAQAFAPQTVSNGVVSTGCSNTTGSPGLAALCNTANGAGKPTASSDSFTQQTLGLFFGIAFLALTAFTFLCIAALLIVRYLMLGGLLIVLPIAWLTYIFPKFDSNFSKWWNAFVKWTLFPPIALFFIYLAFITAANTGTSATAYLSSAAGLPSGAATGPEGALVYQIGLPGAVQQAADEILLVGLTIMGLMFAQSLSGKAGKATVGAVSGGTKAFGTWASKAGRRTGYKAAAWAAKPRSRVDPATGRTYTPITGARANTARWFGQQANKPDLKTKSWREGGVVGSVFEGMKKGSGLFKEKGKAADWACQVCGDIQRSTKKPTGPCRNGHPAAAARWTKVGS